ncbi:MAG: gliding motility lipoprotein GldJ [Bacteroidota bacterium]|jgi:hypothetical protein|nr:gliding motility lipoprotein GldJ [Bacteroidota bacterium]
MALRNYLICFCLLLCCLQGKVSAQENLFFKGSQISHLKVDEENIAIFNRPVTNREYIIYLQWLRGVLYPNYPDIYLNSIPGIDLDALHKASRQSSRNINEINAILNYCKPFVKDYMFNPKYLDYPVVGVSWQNANNYGLWLADRYNEYTLIKMKYLPFCYSPTENDYFSTDLYLAGRWQGSSIRHVKTGDPLNPERDFNWSDNILIPAFRLPSRKEIKAAGDTSAGNDYFKPYPFSKKNFLAIWEKRFLNIESDNVLNLWVYKEMDPNPERIIVSGTSKVNITGELFLDLKNQTNETSLPEIYKQNGQELKSIENYMEAWKECCAEGLNSTPVICEDKNGKPVLVTPYQDLQAPNYKEFSVFRLACALKEVQVKKHKK